MVVCFSKKPRLSDPAIDRVSALFYITGEGSNFPWCGGTDTRAENHSFRALEGTVLDATLLPNVTLAARRLACENARE